MFCYQKEMTTFETNDLDSIDTRNEDILENNECLYHVGIQCKNP